VSGLGLPIANALSRSFVIDVCRAGGHWRQSFARGTAKAAVERVGPSVGTSATFTFWPDPEIFKQTTSFPRQQLTERFRELAGLLPGSRFTFVDADGKAETFHYPDGLLGLLAHFSRGTRPLCAPMAEIVETEDGRGSIAYAWFDGPPTYVGFCNGARIDQGLHLAGARAGLVQHFPDVVPELRALRERQNARRTPPVTLGEIMRDGLIAVVSVALDNPAYQGARRDTLINEEAYRLSVA
jgi:DNA gyrase subunit B